MPKSQADNMGLRPKSLMNALQQKGAKSFGNDVLHPDLVQTNVKKSGSGKAGIKAKSPAYLKTEMNIKKTGTGQARIKGK
jgi:hypothetical protein